MGRIALPPGTNRKVTVQGRTADFNKIRNAARIKKQSFASFLIQSAVNKAKRIIGGSDND